MQLDYLSLALAILSLIGAVASAWFARRNNVRELENDVEEIAGVVEKIHRESKRQQMRRVREAAPDAPVIGPPGSENLSLPIETPQTQSVSKDMLRRMATNIRRQ